MKDNCIFCKIIQGSVPSNKVYEDEYFLAFLDINPLGPGHVQVIPKKHFRYVWDLPNEENIPGNIRDYFAIVQKIATAQKKAFNADIIRSQIYGEEVEHAHVWIWPETPGNSMNFTENRDKIKNALK